MSVAVFIPSPRIHNNWDAVAKLPWYCSEKAAELYKRMLQIRYQLTPYIYSYVVKASFTGEPVIRPMVYHDREDSRTYQISDQFYMGEFLLIAPVTQKGAVSRNVYLPRGKWVNFWTDEEFEGPVDIKVQTPLFKPEGLPVFVKKGAVMPQQPFTLTLDNEPPERLTFDMYPENSKKQTIYEGDKTVTVVESCLKNGTLKIAADNRTARRRLYRFRIHNVEKPGEVTRGGISINYELENSLLVVDDSVNPNSKTSFAVKF